MAAASSPQAYYARQPEPRRSRLLQIRDALAAALDRVEQVMRYGMPGFVRDGRWVCLANQKHYLAVYFCTPRALTLLRRERPELDYGKGCVRIRDTQPLPLAALTAALVRELSRERPAHGEPG